MGHLRAVPGRMSREYAGVPRTTLGRATTREQPVPDERLLVRIAVTGSIATDHLMTFQGKFSESLVPEQLDKISLSFLSEDLQIHRGGCAGNIVYAMGSLGLRPVLVDAVGADFDDYRRVLESLNVDCDSVHVSTTRHTARFVCTTDQVQAQLGTFYTGAMAESRDIELAPVADRVGGLQLVVVGPGDPEAMVRHTEECRQRGFAFAADPSQQLALADGDTIRTLIEGASYLFTNEYESALTEKKTGWSGDEILERVGVRVTTLGKDGVRVERKGEEAVVVPAVPVEQILDPTGVGDGFRAGFIAGLGWDLSWERCAQLGCLVAAYVIGAQDGPQGYSLTTDAFLERLAAIYGAEAAADVRPHLNCPVG